MAKIIGFRVRNQPVRIRMNREEFNEIANESGWHMAALCARVKKVPLAQAQLWLRQHQWQC